MRIKNRSCYTLESSERPIFLTPLEGLRTIPAYWLGLCRLIFAQRDVPPVMLPSHEPAICARGDLQHCSKGAASMLAGHRAGESPLRLPATVLWPLLVAMCSHSRPAHLPISRRQRMKQRPSYEFPTGKQEKKELYLSSKSLPCDLWFQFSNWATVSKCQAFISGLFFCQQGTF